MTPAAPVPPAPEALIALSEAAERMPSASWSEAALAQAYPGLPTEALRALPVGERDRALMALRSTLDAGPMRSEPVCATCGETFEIEITAADIGLAPDQARPETPRDGPVRAVTLGDLIAVEGIADAEAAARALAARIGAAELYDTAPDELGAQIEALDPAADIWLSAPCPECGARTDLAIDPVYFLALELRARRDTLLRDVATLARAFHWSEADILALPATRRAFYLAAARAEAPA
jgi:hypothetical protein